jgi:serine/threonine-protein kinase
MRQDAVITSAPLATPRSLPTDLVQRSARNVRAAALVIGGLWLLGFFMNEVIFKLWFNEPGVAIPFPLWAGRWIGVGGFVSTAAVLALTHRVGDRHLIHVGLAHEVISCWLIGAVTYVNPSRVGLHVAWIILIILTYASIVPARPLQTLVAGLAAASAAPLALILAARHGAPMPYVTFTLLWHLLPLYVAAVLTVVPSMIIRRLGKQVQAARDLGSYRLGEVIGSGGMGQVYRATHRLLARPAAIKLIRPEVLASRTPDRQRTTIERFRREAEAAASLRSPHTIALYDFGVSEEGVFYYVMELLDGLDLDTLVERFGPLPPERAIHLLCQACESLGEAHARGLMHRDIKPSNIQTCRMGLEVDFVKLLDFGLVKPTPSRPSATMPKLTASDAVGAPGTPAYMAPEAVFNDPVPDHRADIYALGCVAYWLLTGTLVFDGSTSAKILVQHLENDPVPPSRRLGKAIPPELEQVVLACLAKRPQQRPANTVELAARLASCPVAEPWTAQRAQEWWEQHLPISNRNEMTTPEPADFHVDFATASPWV